MNEQQDPKPTARDTESIGNSNNVQNDRKGILNDNLRQRAAKRLLRVTFQNNDVICYKNATTTFTESLKRIGLENIQKLGLEVAHVPLVGKVFYPKYKAWMKAVGGGWYVMVQSDTDQKLRQLMSIRQQLNLDFKTEIGTDFKTSNIKEFKKTRNKNTSLLVKFPDGNYIGGENPINTYIETIQKIGVSALWSKHLELSNKPLFTREKQYNGQIMLEDNLWLTVPSLTKDKIKYLKVISAIMNVKIEITIS